MELNYIKQGEGQALIILHGLFGSLDNWMTLGKKFSENYEVWMLDQRNHGHSPHSDEMDYALMAEDLHNFINEHTITDPIVLGHSMGGKTAMEHVLKYPQEVSKLIVADMSPTAYRNHFGAIIKGLEAVKPSTLSERKDADEKMRPFVSEKAIRQFLLKNLHRTNSGNYEWRFNLKVIAREIENISSWKVEGEAVDIDALFIKGEKSDYINEENKELINELFPKAKIIELENAGHWLHAENPEGFYKVVIDFIES